MNIVGQRNLWNIQKPSTELAEAARKKQLHHWERKKWWENQLAKVLNDAQQTGIKVIQSDAKSYSSNVGFGPRLEVSSEFQLKATEASQKITLHDAKWVEYRGWAELLEGAGGRTFDLDVNDFQFFFSNYSIDESEEA